MRRDQKGAVGPIEIVLIVILIAAVGFTIWQVNKADQEVSESATNATASSEQVVDTGSQNQSSDNANTIPEGWVEYSDERTGVSFYHPSEWGTVEVEKVDQVWKGHKYEGRFTDKNNVIVSYASSDFAFGGGGCDLSRIHSFTKDPSELEQITEAYSTVQVNSGEDVLLYEGSYSTGAGDTECIDEEDFDSARIGTGNEQYPAFGLVFEYDSDRTTAAQKDFLEVVSTLQTN
ncbi:MAG: hypothetical protein R3313_04505 [Candidatus Saccharimonadales bacterium]|nr:hypothetical protein [Candidatus Saccharimonadales bacterium]